MICFHPILATLGLLLAASAAAQPADSTATRWHLVIDGRDAAWPLGRALPADSLDTAATEVLHEFQREGYYFATVDSARVGERAATLFVRRGPEVEIGSVEIDGVTVFDAERVRDRMTTRPGRPLDPDALGRDLDALVADYERAGYPLAEATLADVTLDERDGAPRLHLTIRVAEGETLAFGGLELVPGGRTAPGFASRTVGLRPGAPLATFAPERIRQDLEETGLFDEVGQPELALRDDGTAVVRVPAREAAPGTFDLVFGYLPPSGPGDSGSVVGNGSLVLRNLFGHGRALALALVRNPGLVSSLDVALADPFVLGLPLRLEAQFSGYQQDSTYQQQRYGLEAGYRFAPGLEALVTASREYVQAGIAGIVLVEGRQRIPEADAWFAGVGVRYRRVDERLNPRRGLFVQTTLEQGVKRRDLAQDTAAVAAPVNISQQRLLAEGRLFLPTLRRQVLVIGGDAAILLGDVYDESDLFRFGGATSLRGYDEERFRGNIVGRAVVEYRYQIDRTSYAFLFTDIGYVERPATPGVASDRSVRPGYGLGIQYRTPLGLVAVSYALNPDDGPTRGKIHVGLSVGL
ncbi:MAG: BamA/TamA family outer membrane protein [Rhodothermales bacterium]